MRLSQALCRRHSRWGAQKRAVLLRPRFWAHAALLVSLATLPSLAGIGAPSAAWADPGDLGVVDQNFTGVTNAPTADKPQSKLWFNDDQWWAVMFDSTSDAWHIFRLDRPTETWVDTGTPVDARPQTLADALWDGRHLYIASNWVTASTQHVSDPSIIGKPARLYRYSYDAATGRYTLDPGFPSQINNTSSESLTIDEDSTGRIWATWTKVSPSAQGGYTSTVMVSYSQGGTTWATPMVLPVAGVHPAPDDISAVVSFQQNKIGVMWSNQLDDTVYWAVHPDGSPINHWIGGAALRGPHEADDHINLKTVQSDPSGRVFAAVKTSLDEQPGAPDSSAQLKLLVYRPGTGSWTSTTFGTVSDCHTRPLVMLDNQNDQVHMFATAPTSVGCPYAGSPGTIYEKVADMDNPDFAPGRGTPVIRDADSAHMNNVTSTKQSVNHSTGLVVLASNTSTSRYWHADLAIPDHPVVPPIAGFTSATTSGPAPLTVSFTDTSSGNPAAWHWDFGDGQTSTEQNPTVSYAAPGTYTVTMSATNTAGTSDPPASATVTVQSPTSSTGIVRASDTTAVATTAADGLTIDKPAGTTTGNVLLACLALNGTSVATPPAGWTRIATTTGTGQSNPRVYGFYKIADGSEPSTYHWTFARAVTSSGGIARYTGTSGPQTQVSIASGPTATTATLPGVDATTDNAMLTGCMGINSGSTSVTITAPPGMSQIWDLDGKRHEFDDSPLTTNGPTGTRTWHFSHSRAWAGWLTTLTPSTPMAPREAC